MFSLPFELICCTCCMLDHVACASFEKSCESAVHRYIVMHFCSADLCYPFLFVELLKQERARFNKISSVFKCYIV